MRILPVILTFCLFYFGCSSGTNNTHSGVTENQAAEQPDTPASKKKNMVFFGDSLTAGHGLDEPTDQSFTAHIQHKIDSLGLPYKVINAGVSGETTAGGKARIDWILRQPIDIFVLELGGNDGLRGIDPENTRENLQFIIDRVKTKYPDAKIVLVGMEAPPNMGEHFTRAFHNVYPELAEKNQLPLVPFLLENVAGIPELNQRDGIHPTAEGHRILAENVWKVLRNIL